MAANNKLKSKNTSSDSNAVSNPHGGRRSVVHAPSVLAKDDDRPNLAYKVLSAQKTKKLIEASDVNELECLVTETLEIKDPNLDLKAALKLDYYVSALWWCKQQSYSADQTSAFFTVIDTLLKNVEEKKLSLAENLLYFKSVLVGIRPADKKDASSSEQGGGLHALFDVSQAKNIVAYINTCYIQHHSLYDFVFCTYQSEHVVGNAVPVETLPSIDVHWPPPLCEAIALSSHEEFFQQLSETFPLPNDEVNLLEHVTEVDENPADIDDLPTSELVQRGAEVLSKLTQKQIQRVVDETCSEMLSGVEIEVANTLRLKENDVIAKIKQLNDVSIT